MLRVVENEARRGIDGGRHGIGGRIGNLTSMQLKCLKLWFSDTVFGNEQTILNEFRGAYL